MADLVMGAMGNLVPKLYELLKEEYKLQTGMKERIRSLTQEFEAAQAALCKVAEVPWDQLDKQVQIWARQVREASYDMEDVLDTFLVRVQGPDSAEQEKSFLMTLKKMANLFKKSKARRKISGEVKDIISHLQEVTERCRRYNVHDIMAMPAKASPIDPRLHAMYKKVQDLVGIDESSSELISMLQPLQQDGTSNLKMKIVSIVGVGGLGKTTLAKAVYDELKGDFSYGAFVPVGRNPELKKVLKDILMDLDKQRRLQLSAAVLDERQLIDELHSFLKNKRCLIVIDDLWEEQSWKTLKWAIPDDQSCEGRIIVTTRIREVANNADEVYDLPPLPYGSSRKLLYTRIYGDELKEIDYQPDEVTDEILRKCAGIPLAIITMASLLVHEPRARWFDIYKSIGFGSSNNENNVMKILSFSYYDLPSHLRTCLLYLSAFPEDYIIPKVALVWMWVAEGFVQKQQGKGLFETGEGYFNDLINRSLIQQDAVGKFTVSHGCRVHDMVLDFIRSMSHDENFFTVFDISDQGTPAPSNVVRRLAHHNRTMGHSNLANISGMSKVRSFIAPVWKIDTWAPISSFKLLRVLNIGYYRDLKSDHGDDLQFEHLGHLVHLRFLGVSGRWIKKFPKEMGSLKMLQTLDLYNSTILELPSSSSLPTELVCLRIHFHEDVRDAGMYSVGRLTSLEELSVYNCQRPPSCLVKELRNLRELRVLKFIRIVMKDEEMESDFIESLHHLHKLQVLEIVMEFSSLTFEGEILPGDLRTLQLINIGKLWKHCIDPLYHCKLSRLELDLQYMDEEDLKTMGMLPELHFLSLKLSDRSSPTTIGNISDCDACYFPKLRCMKLNYLMVQLVANKGDDGKKTVSFHIWNDIVDDSIIVPHFDSDSELQGDEELQLLSVSNDAPPVSDEENKEGCISIREGDGVRAAAPRFMPKLQELHFMVCGKASRDPRYCNNLGLEFLPSLQEIHVKISAFMSIKSAQMEKVNDALRSAAKVHPNDPTIHFLRPSRHA